VRYNSANLEISWENSYAKFEVLRKKIAIASIEKVLAGPSAADYLFSIFTI
jgi:hypothetical protein